MANITPAQIVMLQMLRKQHHLDDDTYRNMLHEASEGRTTSTKELQQLEAFKLIDGLAKKDATSMAMDKMRKKIIGYAREMQWWLPGDLRKVDMDRVNRWCEKYGFGKKALNKYTYKELPKLVSQFETGPYKHYLNKV